MSTILHTQFNYHTLPVTPFNNKQVSSVNIPLSGRKFAFKRLRDFFSNKFIFLKFLLNKTLYTLLYVIFIKRDSKNSLPLNEELIMILLIIFITKFQNKNAMSRGVVWNLSGRGGSVPVGAWKPLKSIDYTGPGRGFAPRAPPPWLRLWLWVNQLKTYIAPLYIYFGCPSVRLYLINVNNG